MTKRPENPMKRVYERLAAIGMSRRWVRRIVLPDWWDDRIARTRAGFAEGLMLISRHTGLTMRQLRGHGRIRLKVSPTTKFKGSAS